MFLSIPHTRKIQKIITISSRKRMQNFLAIFPEWVNCKSILTVKHNCLWICTKWCLLCWNVTVKFNPSLSLAERNVWHENWRESEIWEKQFLCVWIENLYLLSSWFTMFVLLELICSWCFDKLYVNIWNC